MGLVGAGCTIEATDGEGLGISFDGGGREGVREGEGWSGGEVRLLLLPAGGVVVRSGEERREGERVD